MIVEVDHVNARQTEIPALEIGKNRPSQAARLHQRTPQEGLEEIFHALGKRTHRPSDTL
jgi:hypothetical protein